MNKEATTKSFTKYVDFAESTGNIRNSDGTINGNLLKRASDADRVIDTYYVSTITDESGDTFHRVALSRHDGKLINITAMQLLVKLQTLGDELEPVKGKEKQLAIGGVDGTCSAQTESERRESELKSAIETLKAGLKLTHKLNESGTGITFHGVIHDIDSFIAAGRKIPVFKDLALAAGMTPETCKDFGFCPLTF